MAHYILNSSNFSGYVNNNQLIHSNAVYIIEDDINLSAATLTIPTGCILLFQGGSFTNGTIKGNHTALSGAVKVDKLEESFSTPVKSSFSTMGNNLDKLTMLLTLDVKTLFLDEDFSLNFNNAQQAIGCQYIQRIIGENINISATVNTATPFWAIVSYNLKELRGITFDGQNNPFVGFLAVHCSAIDSTTIENVTVKNIVNPYNNSCIQGIYINNYGADNSTTQSSDCKITIRNVCMSNLWQKGNGTITDGEGAITSVYVYSDASAFVHVRIDNCRFNDLHCFNSIADHNHLLYEDSAGIYVSSKFKSGFNGESNNTVEISNIQGSNFGKRLIKTDSANVIVRNIFGTNQYFDFLCLVGLNASDTRFKYANVQNIHYEGAVGYNGTIHGSFTIGIAMQHTVAEKIVSKVTINNANAFFYPAEISANDVTIRDLSMYGSQIILLPQNENIRFENVTYDDTIGISNGYNKGIIMPKLGASAIIDGLKVKSENKTRLIYCNYREANSSTSRLAICNSDIELARASDQDMYKTSIIDGREWENSAGSSVVHTLNLTMKDCICRHAENFNHFPFVKKHGQWILENIKIEYENIPSNITTLFGRFYVYNNLTDGLTMKDISVVNHSADAQTVNLPACELLTEESVVGTMASLSNICANCANFTISLNNVCWDTYIPATVKRNQFNLFGTGQKGFMVKDYSTGKKYVWSGTQWGELSV